MKAQWEKVFDAPQMYRAEIVRSVLEDQGIPAVLINKQDSSYRFGQIEIHVNREDVLRALKLINDHIQFD